MASQSLLPDGGWAGTGFRLPNPGVASASSSSGLTPVSFISDGNLTTAWRPQSVCPSGPATNTFCCEPEWVQLTVPSTSVLGGLVIRASRSQFGPSRVLTGRLEFLSFLAGSGAPASRDIVLNPVTGDWALQFLNVISGAGTIRFRPGWADAASAGIAELELYAP